ncbi:type II secretion system protein GspM [Parasphingorhabdus sp.]|uniref:type II secretion system protein GspM n=1 Tax=Parasphingorhabdus sp. TaxID=2709688 RepID=UPI003001396B
MIDNARNWFVGLSQREKIMVGIAGLLLAGLVGYYGIARPMFGAMTAAEERYVGAVERQVRIDAKVAALQQPVDGQVAKFSGAIDAFVGQSAGETGIAVASVTPQSDSRVNMVVESAKPTALFGWLARIEREGIAVESLSINPAGNGTISANLTLRSH